MTADSCFSRGVVDHVGHQRRDSGRPDHRWQLAGRGPDVAQPVQCFARRQPTRTVGAGRREGGVDGAVGSGCFGAGLEQRRDGDGRGQQVARLQLPVAILIIVP